MRPLLLAAWMVLGLSLLGAGNCHKPKPPPGWMFYGDSLTANMVHLVPPEDVLASAALGGSQGSDVLAQLDHPIFAMWGTVDANRGTAPPSQEIVDRLPPHAIVGLPPRIYGAAAVGQANSRLDVIREETRTLAETAGLQVLDLCELFPDASWFVDGIHLTEEGSRVLCEAVTGTPCP